MIFLPLNFFTRMGYFAFSQLLERMQSRVIDRQREDIYGSRIRHPPQEGTFGNFDPHISPVDQLLGYHFRSDLTFLDPR